LALLVKYYLHDYIKEDEREWHIELVMDNGNAYRDLVRKPKGKIPL